MSFRECDYIYVKHLCDEWLAWYNQEYMKHKQMCDSLTTWQKIVNLVNHASITPYFYLSYYKGRVEALHQLVSMDGGLNRIVNLSAEDAYILSLPRRNK
jgi:hypothetical protein